MQLFWFSSQACLKLFLNLMAAKNWCITVAFIRSWNIALWFWVEYCSVLHPDVDIVNMTLIWTHVIANFLIVRNLTVKIVNMLLSRLNVILLCFKITIQFVARNENLKTQSYYGWFNKNIITRMDITDDELQQVRKV